MKTLEDEAFDDLTRRQGMWGGGFPAKRQAAMDKINSYFDEVYKKMHEDRAMYNTSWSKNGERIDPASVYLEEPAQEPVAMYGHCPLCRAKGVSRERRLNGNDLCERGHIYPSRDSITPPKREWVGLTLDEIEELFQSAAGADEETVIRFARLIESKIKEKNT
jgi:hypothetical protein